MLVDVNSDQQNRGLQASLVIDRDTAARLGITPQTIDDTLYDAFGQRQVSTMYTPLNQYHVVMEVEPQFWQNPETLKDIYVRSSTKRRGAGAAQRLHALRARRHGRWRSITRASSRRSRSRSTCRPGVALGDAVTAIERRGAREIGMPASIHGSFQGTAQAFQASLANEPLLILAALVTVYIVLGMLYESYIHPITILSTLPSAGVGAILALMLCRTDLSVIALIGIILLIGIVKKNAIMMIDFALEAERKEGKSPEDAIYEACLLRFRPIMMTTMAALLGGLPLALGTGIGSELRRPLGIAIVGGLIVSQMLTLYTTPVVYLYLDRRRPRLRQAKKKKKKRNLEEYEKSFGLHSSVPTTSGRRAETPPAFQGDRRLEDGRAAGRRRARAVVGGLRRSRAERPRRAREHLQSERRRRGGAVPPGACARRRGAGELLSRPSRSVSPPARTRARRRPSGSSEPSVAAGRSVAAPAASSSDYAMPIDVSWEPDLWGRIRRSVEASAASAQASAADLESARLSLQAELASDYFQLRALDSQKQLLDDTATAFERSLALTKNRYAGGIASRLDVAEAQTQLDTTQAQAIDVGVARPARARDRRCSSASRRRAS